MNTVAAAADDDDDDYDEKYFCLQDLEYANNLQNNFNH